VFAQVSTTSPLCVYSDCGGHLTVINRQLGRRRWIKFPGSCALFPYLPLHLVITIANMDGRFILVTGVVVFGLCVPCPVSSSTGISNGSSIEISIGNFSDDSIEFATENSKFVNKTINLPKNYTDIVINHNFTGVVIDNTTSLMIGNLTKYFKGNNTKIIIENSTDLQLTGPFVCTVLRK